MRARRQQAQAVVELAIAMTVLLWFAVGTLDFGRVFYTYIGLTNAAREGARGMTRLAPADADPTTHVCTSAAVSSARAVVRAAEQGFFPAAVPDSVIGVDCSIVDRRTVTIINYPFQPLTPFIARVLGDGSLIHLSTSATLPVLSL
jgi:TadE-like protein